MSAPRTPPPRPPRLSPREWDVARLCAQGWSNAAIAEQLTISRSTVEVHLEHIAAKWGLDLSRHGIANSRAITAIVTCYLLDRPDAANNLLAAYQQYAGVAV